VRNGLTAVAQRRPDTRKRVLRSHRKQMLPIVRHLQRAIDTRDALAAEAGVRELLRSNRDTVLDLIAGPVN
jgi:hypothetical protein